MLSIVINEQLSLGHSYNILQQQHKTIMIRSTSFLRFCFVHVTVCSMSNHSEVTRKHFSLVVDFHKSFWFCAVSSSIKCLERDREREHAWRQESNRLAKVEIDEIDWLRCSMFSKRNSFELEKQRCIQNKVFLLHIQTQARNWCGRNRLMFKHYSWNVEHFKWKRFVWILYEMVKCFCLQPYDDRLWSERCVIPNRLDFADSSTIRMKLIFRFPIDTNCLRLLSCIQHFLRSFYSVFIGFCPSLSLSRSFWNYCRLSHHVTIAMTTDQKR